MQIACQLSMISNNMLFINWIYCNWFLLHLWSMTIDNYFPVDVIKPLTLASICGGSNNLLLCSILNLYLCNIVNRCCVNIGSVKITVLLKVDLWRHSPSFDNVNVNIFVYIWLFCKRCLTYNILSIKGVPRLSSLKLLQSIIVCVFRA
jgi:hypothetical protein